MKTYKIFIYFFVLSSLFSACGTKGGDYNNNYDLQNKVRNLLDAAKIESFGIKDKTQLEKLKRLLSSDIESELKSGKSLEIVRSKLYEMINSCIEKVLPNGNELSKPNGDESYDPNKVIESEVSIILNEYEFDFVGTSLEGKVDQEKENIKNKFIEYISPLIQSHIRIIISSSKEVDKNKIYEIIEGEKGDFINAMVASQSSNDPSNDSITITRPEKDIKHEINAAQLLLLSEITKGLLMVNIYCNTSFHVGRKVKCDSILPPFVEIENQKKYYSVNKINEIKSKLNENQKKIKDPSNYDHSLNFFTSFNNPISLNIWHVFNLLKKINQLPQIAQDYVVNRRFFEKFLFSLKNYLINYDISSKEEAKKNRDYIKSNFKIHEIDFDEDYEKYYKIEKPEYQPNLYAIQNQPSLSTKQNSANTNKQKINQAIQNLSTKPNYKKHMANLGLEDQFTYDDLRKKYKKLSLIHHPDKGGDAEKFKVIHNSYEYFKNLNEIKKFNISELLLNNSYPDKEVQRLFNEEIRNELGGNLGINSNFDFHHVKDYLKKYWDYLDNKSRNKSKLDKELNSIINRVDLIIETIEDFEKRMNSFLDASSLENVEEEEKPKISDFFMHYKEFYDEAENSMKDFGEEKSDVKVNKFLAQYPSSSSVLQIQINAMSKHIEELSKKIEEFLSLAD